MQPIMHRLTKIFVLTLGSLMLSLGSVLPSQAQRPHPQKPHAVDSRFVVEPFVGSFPISADASATGLGLRIHSRRSAGDIGLRFAVERAEEGPETLWALSGDLLIPLVEAGTLSLRGNLGGGYQIRSRRDNEPFGQATLGIDTEVARNVLLSFEGGLRAFDTGRRETFNLTTEPVFTVGLGVRLR